MVNFEVQIRFCQEKCEQVRCGGKGVSYGRRKKRETSLKNGSSSLFDDEDVYFDHDNYDTIRAVVQDESPSIILFPEDTAFPTTVYGSYTENTNFDSSEKTSKETTGVTEESSTHRPEMSENLAASKNTPEYTHPSTESASKFKRMPSTEFKNDSETVVSTLTMDDSTRSDKTTSPSKPQTKTSNFNRKFAFIHNEENNSYTTPMTSSNYYFHTKRLPEASSPRNQSTLESRHFYNTDYHNHRLDLRKDPFSAARNPYYQPSDTVHPLDPQRLVDPSRSNIQSQSADPSRKSQNLHPSRNWDHSKPHEIPGSWDQNQFNPQLLNQATRYNIYNFQETDNRQPRIVTTAPNFRDRPKEITDTVSVQSGVQIQRPLEILDFPRERSDRLPASNQGRPVEIPNTPDRNINYQPNRYDFNRPVPLPRPGDQQHWNTKHNRPSVVQTLPPMNTNNRWNGQNSRDKPNEQNYNRNDVIWRTNFYASQPQYRPSEVIATTQKSIPEEVPLSLAILVGEDGKSQNSAKPKQVWRPPTQINRGLQRHNIINTPRPQSIEEEDDKVCTSKATVIATAVSVTLVYLGVVAGAFIGYRWHRKNRRRKAMTTPIHYPPPNQNNANVTYSTPDVTFRNVYGNFPVSSTSTT
ncbi:uncharacterized protein [Parasteatoda tepidariorum]|uniref:uncharacterized protein n=1 Tax=Parasteatoda tepidariorum TaxID=114398 RepID=UPI001C726FA5|nr:uncharacterized protein LOC122271619 [Parasteatoda tepidariorum]